jgi:hypothetical protein
MPAFFVLVMSYALEGFSKGEQIPSVEVAVVNLTGRLGRQIISDLKGVEGSSLLRLSTARCDPGEGGRR